MPLLHTSSKCPNASPSRSLYRHLPPVYSIAPRASRLPSHQVRRDKARWYPVRQGGKTVELTTSSRVLRIIRLHNSRASRKYRSIAITRYSTSPAFARSIALHVSHSRESLRLHVTPLPCQEEKEEENTMVFSSRDSALSMKINSTYAYD